MPLPTAPPMIRPSASVAIRVRDRAIQIASTSTATALMIIRPIWAIWLSFWNQPKLIPTFQASTRSKNGVTLTAPRWAMSNTNSSQTFDAWSRISTVIAAMMPGPRRELRKRSMPDTYLAFFFFCLLFPDFLAAFFFFALLAICFSARFVVGEAFLGLAAFLDLAAFLASAAFLALSAFS